MPHNIPLPKHRYVFVRDEVVLSEPQSDLIPAIWFGISSHPGRMIGCHVMLESGAVVLDLPPFAIFSDASVAHVETDIINPQEWDCFGWDMEVVNFPYLDDANVEIIKKGHEGRRGRLWFAVDWVNNGFSDYPEQHKLMWCIALDDGRITFQPQNHFIVTDSSFTEGPVHRVKRQKMVWRGEQ